MLVSKMNLMILNDDQKFEKFQSTVTISVMVQCKEDLFLFFFI
jgi:hypothetical protein